MDAAEFDKNPYLSFATKRKSGVYVNTPVWFAAIGARLYVFSAGNSGKAKRVRNFAETRVALCDIRGNVKGEWREAKARIVTDESVTRPAYAALRTKYGFMMWLTDVGSRLTGKMNKRVLFEIELA